MILMKKINLSYLFSFLSLMLIFLNYETIANTLSKEDKDLRTLYLMNCPNGATVTFEGKNYEITNEDYIKYKVVTYDKINMPALKLPFKKSGKLTITA
jgi:hypothetical protein